MKRSNAIRSPLAPHAPVERTSRSFAGRRLERLHVHDSEIANGDHANVAAPKAELERVVISGCRLTGARVAGASVRDVRLSGCRIDLAVLLEARIERTVFEDCVIAESSFEGAWLRDVRFERCDLSGVVFEGVRLERVLFDGCRLAGVRLEHLKGARIPWPDLVEHAGELAAALGIEIADDRA